MYIEYHELLKKCKEYHIEKNKKCVIIKMWEAYAP